MSANLKGCRVRIYRMKLCIAFGNCQAAALKLYLSELSSFSETYECHVYANWQLLKHNKLAIPIQQLSHADLILYQPLSDVHGCYSTNKANPESFMSLLSDNCKTISFPRLHNNSLWPLFHKNASRTVMYGKINNHIESMDQLNYLYDNDMIDYDFTHRALENYRISKQKEEETDVKIVDYIYDTMHKQKVFLTHDHPTSCVFNEVTRQVCDVLGIEYNYEKGLTFPENIANLQDSVYHRADKQYPISRYAIKHFGLTYVTDETPSTYEFYQLLTKDYYKKYRI